MLRKKHDVEETEKAVLEKKADDAKKELTESENVIVTWKEKTAIVEKKLAKTQKALVTTKKHSLARGIPGTIGLEKLSRSYLRRYTICSGRNDGF